MVRTSTYASEFAICVFVQLLTPAGFCHTSKYPVPVRNSRISCVPSLVTVNLLTPVSPVVWFPLAFHQCGLRKSVACLLSNLLAPIISSISGVSRSPFGFVPDTSLSAFHPSGSPGTVQDSYPVALALSFIQQTKPTRNFNENRNDNYLH